MSLEEFIGDYSIPVPNFLENGYAGQNLVGDGKINDLIPKDQQKIQVLDRGSSLGETLRKKFTNLNENFQQLKENAKKVAVPTGIVIFQVTMSLGKNKNLKT